ncbi:condensation domain-containing protein [Actinoplanes sp. NPDC049316]|uniref:condensation domain-containing protein n=1 Tax=Actinoplanes sp. NPDC049316 TaxID=3154727 RepID=UPI0034351DA8
MDTAKGAPVGTGDVEDIYELSPLQQGLLLHSMHDGASDMYLSQHTYTLEGPLDTGALVDSWQGVLDAHAVLRTSFHWEGLDKPLQVVHRRVQLPVRRYDWSGLDEPGQQEQLEKLYAEDRAEGLTVTAAPLMRLHLIRLGERRHRLVWTYHHVLMDGWSVPLFLDELMARYRTLTFGFPPPRPVPAYRDYIGWLQRQDLREAYDFWSAALAGVRPTPVAHPGEAGAGTGAVDRRQVVLPPALSDGLRETAARHRVTVSTVVQALWAVVLRARTGAAEPVFGCVTSGRPPELPHVERMVGLFANTLPVRVTVPGEGGLGDWLRELQDAYARMRRYEFTPLADIKKRAGLPGQQLFDSLLVLENYSLTVGDGGEDTRPDALTFRVDSLYDKIDVPLTLTVAPPPVSELHLIVHHDRFEPGFIDDLLESLQVTLAALVTAETVAEVVAAAGPSTPRRAEPAVAPRPAPPATFTAPATPAEERIAAAFREILGLAEVDVTTSFFELGGDSLEAVRTAGRIEGATVGLLTAHPSVRELADALAPAPGPASIDDEIAHLERLLAAKRAARDGLAGPGPVVPVAREETMPCTHQQEGLWFLHKLDPASTVYHVPYVQRLRGPLDVPALERAIAALVVRHEALRTRFVEREGRPRQVIDPPPASLPLPVAEIAAGEVRRWAAAEAHRPFDLGTAPLFRAALARLGPGDHVLVMVAHHIVADGWSAGILARELAVLYTGGDLPPLRIQAADHAVWQRGWLDGAELERQLGYWRTALADLSTVDLPADRPRPELPTGAGASLHRRLPGDLSGAAAAYARTHRVSFLAVLQAAFLTVLRRHTGQDDLTTGSVFSGRTRPEIEPVVGFFANTLVVRTDAGGRPTFAELVERCHASVLAATERQDVPFGFVVDAVRPERVAGRNPLFQISLILQRDTAGGELRLGDITAEPVPIDDHYARFDLLLNLQDSGGHLDLSCEYSTELYDADRVERLLDHFTAALGRGVAAPATPADAIDILPDGERARVLRGRDRTARAYVLDDLLRPLPIGVPGRLFLAGPAPDGREERPDPYAQQPGATMYDSGETARLRADGVLERVEQAGAAAQPQPGGYVAPRTASERWLAEQWQDLLGAERVGATDRFFALGANSLHATQLLARIREELHVQLEARHVFTSQVLEQLAARLDEAEPVSGEDAIVPVPRGAALPCTHQQEGLWFMSKLDPSSAVYHLSSALRLRGRLDVPALERAVTALAGRHEALRTGFAERDGLPFQAIADAPAHVTVPVTELSEDGVTAWVEQVVYPPFDLTAGSLFRAAVGRTAPGEHVLVLVVHHIVADGLSLRFLAEELSELYAAATEGREPHLAPLGVQPADHAVWQRARLDDAELRRRAAYWREALAGVATVDFPSDRPRPARPTGAGATLTRQVGAEVAAAARAYAREHEVSLLAVMQAALLTVLHRYTGQEDLTVGSIFSGRTRGEIENVVGFFVNSLVLRTDVGGDPEFGELVRRCHATVLAATAQQDLPFGLVVDAVQPERVPGRNPLFQICLTLQPSNLRADLTIGDLAAEPVELAGGYARFDLDIAVVDSPGRLDLAVEYAVDLFDAGRIERLLDHYVAALTHALAEPGSPIGDVDIMSDAERHQVLHLFNPAPALHGRELP